ncbi:MAG: sensor histidine kinase [Anaerolineae bacterium]
MGFQNNREATKEKQRSYIQLQSSPLFKDAIQGKPLSQSLVAIGSQSAKKGRTSGFTIIICIAVVLAIAFFSGQLEIRQPYIIFGYFLAISSTAAVILFKLNWMQSYFITLSFIPLISTLIFAIGFNDTAGFFINGIAMSLLVASLIVDKKVLYVEIGVSAIIILFQFLGGPERVFGPIANSYSINDKITIALSWLFIFASIIQININNFQFFLQSLIDLNNELDIAKESILAKNLELDQVNASLEEKVEQRTEELELTLSTANSANQAKTKFLATMSHELRTPLNAILGYSEYIPEILEDTELADPADIDEILNLSGRINTSGRSLLTLINDVLEISRIEAGHSELLISDFEFSELIEYIKTITAPSIRINHNKFVIQNLSKMKNIKSDKEKLSQILINLIGNAAKFTKNGTITLTIFDMLGESLCFEVADTGIGISQQDLSHIFEPFNQSENGLDRKFGGSGLGLAICRQLAVLLKGTIQAESELSKGSTFKLLLPLT